MRGTGGGERDTSSIGDAHGVTSDEHTSGAPHHRDHERDPRLGQLVAGRFRLERRIGGGAMGDVYLALHEGLGRPVAVKVLRASARRSSRARFRREATIAARLTGVHVVRVTDFGELPDGSPFLVMDFVDGPTLASELNRRGRLPVQEAVGRALEICEALAEAHRAGIVHRDIKPANLLLAPTPDGSRVLRVADFGVAKAEGESTLTGDGASLGSPSYMAPEQIVDAHSVDGRADLWAVGVVLYELIAGHRPFEGTSVAGTLLAVAHQQPTRLDDPTLQGLPEPVPAALADVVARCLEKNPDARFPTATALADALAQLAGDAERTTAARIRRVAAVGETRGLAHATDSTRKNGAQANTVDAAGEGTVSATEPSSAMGSAVASINASASTLTGGVTAPSLRDVGEVAASPQPAATDGRDRRPRWLFPAVGMGVAALVALARLRQPASADLDTLAMAGAAQPAPIVSHAAPGDGARPGGVPADAGAERDEAPPAGVGVDFAPLVDSPAAPASSVSRAAPQPTAGSSQASQASGKRGGGSMRLDLSPTAVSARPAGASSAKPARLPPATELDDLGPRK